MEKFYKKNERIAKNNMFKLLDLMKLADIKNYYMAGGCFQKTINDYDLFPVNQNDFDNIIEKLHEHVSFISKNAITVKYNNITVQFCKYHHSSLKELVDSFDFAHCQIGAKIINHTQLEAVYYSTNYVEWKLTDDDFYTGSEYPLSSLFRIFKYKEKFLQGNYKKEVIKVLIDIISRGYEDYDDFKDQLDAIDLAYIEDSNKCKELFTLLSKNKETNL